MRIGVTFNVRLADPLRQPESFDDGGKPRLPGELALPGDDEQEEFDSLETIQALASQLERLGHEVELLGDGEPLLRRLLDGPRPDLVWNVAEGTGRARSREARVPAVLEMLDIPYTGSDPLTLAATLDKGCAKRLVSAAGVATPNWLQFDGDWDALDESLSAVVFPVFVKPAFEGSSKGILTSSVIRSESQLKAALQQLWEMYQQPILVEEFIDGEELTVGVLGNDPPEIIGIMRVLPRGVSSEPFVYSLEVKRDWKRRVHYECPAQLDEMETDAIRAAALACWRALGCRDVSRFDFRLRAGVPYFLETNPLPGMSPESGDLVILSRAMGIEYPELVSRVLQAALDRLKLGEVALAGRV